MPAWEPESGLGVEVKGLSKEKSLNTGWEKKQQNVASPAHLPGLKDLNMLQRKKKTMVCTEVDARYLCVAQTYIEKKKTKKKNTTMLASEITTFFFINYSLLLIFKLSHLACFL